MKFFKILFLSLAMLAASSVFAQNPQQNNSTGTISTTAASCNFVNTTGCVVLPLPNSNRSAAVVTVSGIWTGTLNFIATNSSLPFSSAISAVPQAGGSAVTTATANGSWVIQVPGQGVVGVLASVLSSGSVNVTITSSVAPIVSGGGSGTVTSVSGTANQIDVATGTTTPVISIDSALQLPGTLSMAQAGAASASAFTMSGTPFAGTGTTSTPLSYCNGGTAPTTWSTGGTYIGCNAVSGFVGNFMDFHVNGGGSLFKLDSTGALTANSSVTSFSKFIAGSGSSFQISGKGQFGSPADGVVDWLNNNGNGFTRMSIGPDSSSFPGLCPQTGTVPYLAVDVAGACTTGEFIKTAQTLQVTGADVTCGTTGTLTPCTAFMTITGLSAALPTVATTWTFSCDLVVSQATAAAADQIGVQTATNASTNLAASGVAYTAAAVSTAAAFTGVSSTTAQSIVTFTPGATGTKLPVHVSGTIEGTSTSGTTFNLQVLTGAAGDLLTIYRGSACWIY